MRILIIEDEPQAAQRMETLVQELVPNAYVVGKLDSVRGSVKWF
jgi:DNA-binding LytR/AlgR family response regulator